MDISELPINLQTLVKTASKIQDHKRIDLEFVEKVMEDNNIMITYSYDVDVIKMIYMKVFAKENKIFAEYDIFEIHTNRFDAELDGSEIIKCDDINNLQEFV